MAGTSRRRRLARVYMTCVSVGVAAVLDAGSADPRRQKTAAAVPLSAWEAAALERARSGAVRRLLEADCQKLLTEYADAQGRTLADRLDRLGLTAADYLRQIPFLDGSATRSCKRSEVRLVVIRGRAAVYVCPPDGRGMSGLAQTGLRNPASAEFAIIHEMLHTLGLGENPPTSQQITRRVESRCHR